MLYHAGVPGFNGSLGVEIFFVLSGFLITWLLLKENARTGSISIRGFYLRRTVRIFPAFYACWLAFIILALVRGRAIPWGSAWAAFLYCGNYYGGLHAGGLTFLPHSWSLAVEEQYYLLWPMIFLMCRSNMPRFRNAIMAAIGVLWIYRAALHFSGVSQNYIYRAFETRFDSLLVGCLLAIIMREHLWRRFWRFATSRLSYSLIVLGALICSSLADFDWFYRDVIGLAVEPLLIAVLIVQLFAFDHTKLWSFINWPAARFLGRLSYSLYLYHNDVMPFFERQVSGLPFAARLATAILGTIAVAAASYYLIELPFLQLREQRRPVKMAAASSTTTAA